MGWSEVAPPGRGNVDTPELGLVPNVPRDSDVITGAHALGADVRHDVRHAAATILLLLATIRDVNDDAMVDSTYDAIAHLAGTIATIVDDETARALLPVSIDDVAFEVTRRAALLYPGRLTCDAEPVIVASSRADVTRLLANLVDNSCRAAGRDGTVEVRVNARDEWCELTVGDSGEGFVENLEHRGLGLSSVAAIAVRLEGYVTLGQSSLGGALVTVHLPRSTSANHHHHGGAPT